MNCNCTENYVCDFHLGYEQGWDDCASATRYVPDCREDSHVRRLEIVR